MIAVVNEVACKERVKIDEVRRQFAITLWARQFKASSTS